MRSRRLSSGPAVGGVFLTVVLAGIVAAACTPAASPSRPTDPHLIVTEAVRATAALSTFRLHLESVSTMDATVFGGKGQMQSGMTMDADVDLASRQLAGRQTATMAGANPFGNGAQMPPQTNDMIATSTAMFVRQGGAVRWTKVGGTGLGGGPTNAVVAAAIVGVLDDDRMTYDKADPESCTLGTCDHVIVHLNGPALVTAIAALSGAPIDAPAGMAMPNVDLDVRVDQATSVISEIRFSMAMNGQATQMLLTLANPGDPVRIVAPDPALVDDTLGGGMGGGFGGFGGFGGGQVTTILETVGTEVGPETPMPADPESPTP